MYGEVFHIRSCVELKGIALDRRFPAVWLITSWNTSGAMWPRPPPRPFVRRPDCGLLWWPAVGGLAFPAQGFDNLGRGACMRCSRLVDLASRWRRPARNCCVAEIAIGQQQSTAFSPGRRPAGCRSIQQPSQARLDQLAWTGTRARSGDQFVAPESNNDHRWQTGTGWSEGDLRVPRSSSERISWWCRSGHPPDCSAAFASHRRSRSGYRPPRKLSRPGAPSFNGFEAARHGDWQAHLPAVVSAFPIGGPRLGDRKKLLPAPPTQGRQRDRRGLTCDGQAKKTGPGPPF